MLTKTWSVYIYWQFLTGLYHDGFIVSICVCLPRETIGNSKEVETKASVDSLIIPEVHFKIHRSLSFYYFPIRNTV